MTPRGLHLNETRSPLDAPLLNETRSQLDAPFPSSPEEEVAPTTSVLRSRARSFILGLCSVLLCSCFDSAEVFFEIERSSIIDGTPEEEVPAVVFLSTTAAARVVLAR